MNASTRSIIAQSAREGSFARKVPVTHPEVIVNGRSFSAQSVSEALEAGFRARGQGVTVTVFGPEGETLRQWQDERRSF